MPTLRHAASGVSTITGATANLYAPATAVAASDDTRASWATVKSNTTVHYWAVAAFTEIPAGSTITGVRIGMEHSASAAVSIAVTPTLRNGVTVVGSTPAAQSVATTTDAVQTFTITGVTLGQLTAATFDVGHVASRTVTTAVNHLIDYLYVEVDYTAPTASPVVPLNDSFNRADTAAGLGTADSGQVWRNEGGATDAFGILGGQAYSPSAIDNKVATVDVGGSLMGLRMGCRLSPTAGANVTACNLVMKWTDPSNFMYFEVYGNGFIQIRRVEGGTYTDLATASGIALVDGDLWELERTAAGAYAVYQNGQVRPCAITDNTHAAATRAGLRYGGTGGAAIRWDDLSLVDQAGTAATAGRVRRVGKFQ